MVVEWAIRYDADSQTPVTTTPVSASINTFAAGGDIEQRDVVIGQANNVFNLDPGTPMLYGSGIHETDRITFRDSEGVSPASYTREDTVVPAVPVPSIYSYSTNKEELMFPLGSRENFFQPAHYSCWFPECAESCRCKNSSLISNDTIFASSASTTHYEWSVRCVTSSTCIQPINVGLCTQSGGLVECCMVDTSLK